MISTEAIKVLKERKTLCTPQTSSLNPSKRFLRASVSSREHISLGPQRKSRLPLELLALIVQMSDVDMYFTFTQVNITFRQLVYKYLPPALLPPRELMIHLLNNQKHVCSARLTFQHQLLDSFHTARNESNPSSVTTSSTDNTAAATSTYLSDEPVPYVTDMIFAPEFHLSSVRPDLTSNSKYLNILLQDWEGAHVDIEDSGTFEIFLLRKEMKFACRHPWHFWKHYEGPWEQSEFFEKKHFHGDWKEEICYW